MRSSGYPVMSDDRGKHKPSNKLSNTDYDDVCKHIQSFPVMEAHYVRKDTSKQFLAANLNLTELYRLYKKMKNEKNEKPISKTKYRNIFYTFNLAFHIPQKDRCTESFTYD